MRLFNKEVKNDFSKAKNRRSVLKKELSILLDNPNISIIREGVYNYSRSESLFFVDLEKQGKEERFHFEDYFQGDYFHWDSQTTQHNQHSQNSGDCSRYQDASFICSVKAEGEK